MNSANAKKSAQEYKRVRQKLLNKFRLYDARRDWSARSRMREKIQLWDAVHHGVKL